jgi:hypothetical protein
MVRFARALQGARLLSPAYTDLALSGKEARRQPAGAGTSFQAYGPIAAIVNNQRIVEHGGGTLGEATLIDIYLDSDWTVVILCNYSDQNGAPPIQDLMSQTRQLITT